MTFLFKIEQAFEIPGRGRVIVPAIVEGHHYRARIIPCILRTKPATPIYQTKLSTEYYSLHLDITRIRARIRRNSPFFLALRPVTHSFARSCEGVLQRQLVGLSRPSLYQKQDCRKQPLILKLRVTGDDEIRMLHSKPRAVIVHWEDSLREQMPIPDPDGLASNPEYGSSRCRPDVRS